MVSVSPPLPCRAGGNRTGTADLDEILREEQREREEKERRRKEGGRDGGRRG